MRLIGQWIFWAVLNDVAVAHLGNLPYGRWYFWQATAAKWVTSYLKPSDPTESQGPVLETAADSDSSSSSPMPYRPVDRDSEISNPVDSSSRPPSPDYPQWIRTDMPVDWDLEISNLVDPYSRSPSPDYPPFIMTGASSLRIPSSRSPSPEAPPSFIDLTRACSDT